MLHIFFTVPATHGFVYKINKYIYIRSLFLVKRIFAIPYCNHLYVCIEWTICVHILHDFRILSYACSNRLVLILKFVEFLWKRCHCTKQIITSLIFLRKRNSESFPICTIIISIDSSTQEKPKYPIWPTDIAPGLEMAHFSTNSIPNYANNNHLFSIWIKFLKLSSEQTIYSIFMNNRIIGFVVIIISEQRSPGWCSRTKFGEIKKKNAELQTHPNFFFFVMNIDGNEFSDPNRF